MPRVLVTGGSGFIGTNLVESFLRDGWPVLNFDAASPRAAHHRAFFQQGDIRDAEALKSAVRDFHPDFVVHLAARTDLDGPTAADYDSNTTGVRNMIEAVRCSPHVQRSIFASTRYVHQSDVFPRRDDDYSPFTLYGESKVESEKLVRSSGLQTPWLLIRPTSIWGPWFRVPYRTFFDTVRRGLYVHPRHLRISKCFGYVGNVVHQIRQFLSVDAARIHQRTLYVADLDNIDVLQFAQTIQRAFGAPPVRQVPLSLLKTIAFSGDMMKRLGVANPPLTSFRLGNLLTPMEYDLSATREVAGPSPYNMEEGVRTTVDWIRTYGS